MTGSNDLGDPITLTEGASVDGTVTAPSGAQLKNVDVDLTNKDLEAALNSDDDADVDPSLYASGEGDDYTDVDGSYDVRPLVKGTYDVDLGFDEGYDPAEDHPVGTLTIASDGQALTGQDISRVKVPVTPYFTPSSTAKHKATLKVNVSARYYGVTKPGGKVSAYVDGKRVGIKTLSTGGVATFSLSGLTSGKHTVQYHFSGSVDTRPAWSAARKITVK